MTWLLNLLIFALKKNLEKTHCFQTQYVFKLLETTLPPSAMLDWSFINSVRWLPQIIFQFESNIITLVSFKRYERFGVPCCLCEKNKNSLKIKKNMGLNKSSAVSQSLQKPIQNNLDSVKAFGPNFLPSLPYRTKICFVISLID